MEIRVGSIVRLKSGSPDMVVESVISQEDGSTLINTRWYFEGNGHVNGGEFLLSSLLLVSDDSTVADK